MKEGRGPARTGRREFLHLWGLVVMLTGGWRGRFNLLPPVISVCSLLVISYPCSLVSKEKIALTGGAGFILGCNHSGWGSPVM